jgi:hypothetical protein
MWAWSHAAVVTPDGLEVPDGTYISWMSDRHLKLLDADAVGFVATELDRAEADANQMVSVGGPLLVFDRRAIEAVHRADPTGSFGEHIEDAVALALKWGLPVLAATAADWLGAIDHHDGAVVQLGTDLNSTKTPTLVVGRADVVDPRFLARLGVASQKGAVRDRGFRREVVAGSCQSSTGWAHLGGDAHVDVERSDDVLVTVDGWPSMVASGGDAWWQPPDLSDPANPLLPRSQYGSVASAIVAARWWSRQPGDVVVEPLPVHEPITVQWWATSTDRTLLVGNLETGWIGDSRTPRTVSLTIRDHDGHTTRHIVDVPPEGCTVQQLVTTPATQVGDT